MQACGPDFSPASSSLDILPPVSFWILLLRCGQMATAAKAAPSFISLTNYSLLLTIKSRKASFLVGTLRGLKELGMEKRGYGESNLCV